MRPHCKGKWPPSKPSKSIHYETDTLLKICIRCRILVLPSLIDAEFKFTEFLVMPNIYVTESSGHPNAVQTAGPVDST